MEKDKQTGKSTLIDITSIFKIQHSTILHSILKIPHSTILQPILKIPHSTFLHLNFLKPLTLHHSDLLETLMFSCPLFDIIGHRCRQYYQTLSH